MEQQINGDESLLLPARQSENETNNVHIIDIQKTDNNVSSSSSNHQEHMTTRIIDESTQQDDLEEQSSSGQNHEASTSRASSNQRLRSPLNSRLWIPVELFITICQLIALVVVLSRSRNEKTGLPLFVWIVGYASGCVASLPVLCWHYYNIKKSSEQDANRINNNVSTLEDGDLNVSSTEDDENQQRMLSTSTSIQQNESSSLRISRSMSGALDFFFAVWFVFGNICLFGGYASPVDDPHIYKLCLIFIILSYIGYAMPLILCATICCFLPCIVNAIDSQEDQYQTRGASVESINALPTYKFKLKGGDDDQDLDLEQKQKLEALKKDSVCCVCLSEFEDDEEMRELPCLHFFHVECIDTWLKLNATCPLCKFEIGLSDGASPPTSNSNTSNSNHTNS